MSILLIGEDGTKLGSFTFDEAKRKANQEKKSLVLVDARNNVYKIIDSGKFKYEQKQKQKDARIQKRTHKIKEIKLGLTTADHDLEIKIKRIREFLQDGLKTKVTLQLKGRQQSHKDIGFKKIQAVIAAAILGGIAIVDRPPSSEGRFISALLSPVKPVVPQNVTP